MILYQSPKTLEIGHHYLFRHSSGIITVKFVGIVVIPGIGGRKTVTRYRLINLKTNRAITAKSRRKFLQEV